MTLDRAWYWTKRRFLQVKKYEQNACVNKEILLHVIVCFCFFSPKERRLETVPRQTLNDRSSSALQSNTFTSGKPICNFSLRYQYTTKQKIKRERVWNVWQAIRRTYIEVLELKGLNGFSITFSTAIEFDPHGDMSIPTPWVDLNILRFNIRKEAMLDNTVLISISLEVLQ